MEEPWFTIIYLSLLAAIGIGYSIYRQRKTPHLMKLIYAGQLMVNGPVFILLLSPPVVMYWLVGGYEWGWIAVIFSVLAGFGLAWLAWSLIVPWWRVWAFNRTDPDDWPKLHKLAVAHRLIWRMGHLFDQSELRSKKADHLIVDIDQRIRFYEEVSDINLDLTLSARTGYKLNKREILIEFIAKLTVLFIVITCFITGNVIIGLILLAPILLIGNSYKLVRKVFDRKDYLIISETGIAVEVPTKVFYNWGTLSRIKLDTQQKVLFLHLMDVKKPVKIQLYQFDIGLYDEFSKRLDLYIDRYIVKRETLSGELN